MQILIAQYNMMVSRMASKSMIGWNHYLRVNPKHISHVIFRIQLVRDDVSSDMLTEMSSLIVQIVLTMLQIVNTR